MLESLLSSAKDGGYAHVSLVLFAVSVVSAKDIVIFLLGAFVTEEFVRRSTIDFAYVHLADVCLYAFVVNAHTVVDDTVVMHTNCANARERCASGNSRLYAHVIHDGRAKYNRWMRTWLRLNDYVMPILMPMWRAR